MPESRSLPPGPGSPSAVQTLGWWTRPLAFLERCRQAYGHRFTIRLLGQPPFVMLSDPDEVRELFTAPPDVLHPGEGARILEPIVGRHSVILLDEGEHLEQRKLMLPAFHGERMERLTGLVAEVADREVASWPRDETVALHPRLQGLTLEIILRAVFGVEAGPRLEALRARLTEILELGAKPLGLLPPLQRDFGGHGPWARLVALREETDALVFDLVDERRRNGGGGDDVLAMLIDARHEDGSPMTAQELRDELMTMLVAGHETTASELAWAFERLLLEPAVLARLVEEIDAGDGEAYLTATVQETLRRRPVLPNAAPRLVKQETTIGGWTYPVGVCLAANAYLLHHDPAIYPDPYAFRPERFLEEAQQDDPGGDQSGEPGRRAVAKPGTYTWIPFGGGRRRCLGASFALLEMRIVLRTVLEQAELRPAPGGPELTRRRSITISPRRSARAILRERPRESVPEAAPVAAVPA